MADIRIKDLATTAASTASDDFVAVDGSANGTRKLNAYSPTFGGNLTVSGTGGSASTISTIGTGTNAEQNSLLVDATTSGTPAAGYGPSIRFTRKGNDGGSSSTSGAIKSVAIAGTGGNQYNADIIIAPRLGGSLVDALTVKTDGGATLAGNLTVSGGTGTIDATSGTASASLNLVGRSAGAARTATIVSNSSGSLVFSSEGAGNAMTLNASTGNLSVAYNLTVSGTTITHNVSSTGDVAVTQQNSSAGTGASTSFKLQNDAAINGTLQLASSGFSGYGAWIANSTMLYCNGNLVLMADGGYLDFTAGGNSSKMRLASTGNFLLGTVIDGGQKLQVAGTANITGDTTFGGNTVSIVPSSASAALVLKRTSNSYGATVEFNTTTTNKWFMGLRGLVNDSFYIYNNVGGDNALIIDTSSNATFAGKITAGQWLPVAASKMQTASTANSYVVTLANTASSGNGYGLRLHTNLTTSSDYLLVASSGADAGTIRFIVKSNGTINAPSLPTSASGLSAGDIWNDGGTLKIV